MKNIGFHTCAALRQHAVIVDAFEARLGDALLAGVVHKSSASRRGAGIPFDGWPMQHMQRPGICATPALSACPHAACVRQGCSRRCVHVHAAAPRGRRAARACAQRLRGLGCARRVGCGVRRFRISRVVAVVACILCAFTSFMPFLISIIFS